MRLAVICGLDIRTWRGGERYAVELSNALIERGHRVTLFSRRQRQERVRVPLEQIQRISKAPIVWFHSIDVPGSPELLAVTPQLAWRLLEFDAVYCINVSSLFNAALALFCRIREIRFVHGMHTSWPAFFRDTPLSRTPFSRAFPIYKALYWRVFQTLPAVHVLRGDIAAELSRLGFHGEVRAIPNFVYWASPPEAELQSSDRFQVLWIGDLDIATKGADLLCEVVNEVLSFDSRVSFRIVGGPGDGHDQVTELARSHPNGVVLRESVSEGELNELYRSSQLFLSTSKVEGFPLTLLEAQTFGLPVLGLAIPGLQAVLSEPLCGRLQDPSHPKELAELIVEQARTFFADPSGYNTRRKAIQSIVKAHFGKDRVVPELETFLSPIPREPGRSNRLFRPDSREPAGPVK